MKWVFRSRTIGTTMSLWDTLDNATYPTTGAKYLELKTKVMWGNVCLIPLSTVKHYGVPLDDMVFGLNILEKSALVCLQI